QNGRLFVVAARQGLSEICVYVSDGLEAGDPWPKPLSPPRMSAASTAASRNVTMSRYVEPADRVPDAEPDSTRHLRQFHHVVREKDQHQSIVRIRLPPTAIRAWPAEGPCTAPTPERIGRFGICHD